MLDHRYIPFGQHSRFHLRSVLVGCCICWFSSVAALAQPQLESEPELPTRELYVPIEQLEALLQGSPERVYLSREEFDQLIVDARKIEQPELPFRASIVAANYRARLIAQSAVLQGSLTIDVLADGLQAIPLALQGVRILRANLDSSPAQLLQQEAGVILVFVEGVGQHTLELEMVSEVSNEDIQQKLSLALPTTPTSQLELQVPGNVEIESGVAVLNRVVNEASGTTSFDVLCSADPMQIVFSLNNRELHEHTTVALQAVLLEEITEDYEHLHATLAMKVIHGAAEELRFHVDESLEVHSVTGEELSRWSIERTEERSVLVLQLQHPITTQTSFNVRLDRKRPQLGKWHMPEFSPQEVSDFRAVLGIVVEDKLQIANILPEELVPIDVDILSAALSTTLLAEQSSVSKRTAVAAFYTAGKPYAISAMLSPLAPRLTVESQTCVVVSDEMQKSEVSFTLHREHEDLFHFDIEMPTNWSVNQVRFPDGENLKYDNVSQQGKTRIRVQFPKGIEPGSSAMVQLIAHYHPVGWLDNWQTQPLVLPFFSVVDAYHQQGIVSLKMQDDLQAEPVNIQNMAVLDNSQLKTLLVEEKETKLAYRFSENTWHGEFVVRRTAPRLTARVLNFVTISPQSAALHSELLVLIHQSSVQQIQFSLPESTPPEVGIQGLGGTVVKETTSRIENGRRRWTVELGKPHRGTVRLAVDLALTIRAESAELELPTARVEHIDYQSGGVAVEGHPELDLEIQEHPRAVDIGEFVDAEYQVGKRLLGAFGYLAEADKVVVKIARRPHFELPATIVQKAALVTILSAQGRLQTAARYRMSTKASYLDFLLPQDSILWSISLDGAPALPQRIGERVSVAIPVQDAARLRDLQIVYQSPCSALKFRSPVNFLTPQLHERFGESPETRLVPVADLAWELILPHGYQLSRVAGQSLHGNAKSPSSLIPMLWKFSGGQQIGTLGGLLEMEPLAHVPARPMAKRSLDSAATVRMADAGMTTQSRAEKESREEVPLEFSEEQSQAVAPKLKIEKADSTALVADKQGNPSGAAAAQVESLSRPAQWALEGVRSLAIDLNAFGNGQHYELTNLGSHDATSILVIDRRRWVWTGWIIGIIVCLLGLLPRSLGARMRYLVLVIGLAMLIPIATGWIIEAEVAQFAILVAVLGLVCLFAVQALTMACLSRFQGATRAAQSPTVRNGTATLILAFALLGAETSSCQGQASPGGDAPAFVPLPSEASFSSDSKQLATLLSQLPIDTKPVEIPNDAILVPYVSQDALGPTETEKLLIPSALYKRLLARSARAQQSTDGLQADQQFAWGNASYSVVLTEKKSLKTMGVLHFEQFVDGEIYVPLRLGGAVIESVELDETSASLRWVAVSHSSNSGPTSADEEQNRDAALYLLKSTGKGTKTLRLTLRIPSNKVESWNQIAASLPTAPATELHITAPEPHTEISFEPPTDPLHAQTAPGETTFEYAIPVDGRLAFRWRSKMDSIRVEHGINVQSTSIFDVSEDRVRLAWEAALEFPGSRLEALTFVIPGEYRIEQVLGQNIRDWSVRNTDSLQTLEIALLKAAVESESVTIVATRPIFLQNATATTVMVKPPTLPNATLLQGRILIRKSFITELTTLRAEGVSRIDFPGSDEEITSLPETGPLSVEPYQAYEFEQPNIQLELSVAEISPRIDVHAQTVLKISQQSSDFETRLLVTVSDRPLHHLQIRLPADVQISTLETPRSVRWSIGPESAEGASAPQILEVILANGFQETLPLVLLGSLPTNRTSDGTHPSQLSLPKFDVLGAKSQSGAIVVQTDPAYSVQLSDASECMIDGLGSVDDWLVPAQRVNARVVVQCPTSDYSGTLDVALKSPMVTTSWASNVRVSDRVIEETLLLLANIESAGIREFTFLLPPELASASIRAPLLRRQTVTPVDETPNSLLRVHLELQDAILGELAIVVEHDRLASSAPQSVAVPVIETGTTNLGYVAIENASQDELITLQQTALRQVESMELSQHRLLAELGSKSSSTYRVEQNAINPQLSYQIQAHEAVETAAARIGLAQTVLMLDSHGNYRASQEYRIENRTEPYLEVQLPEGAELWTVSVAGEPVKPAMRRSSSNAALSQSIVRIPLIRTAEGDLDYPVLLKYGGQLPPPTWFSTTTFPLLKTLNISVELSQVRLSLPEQNYWFNFSGTLGRVESETELQAGWLSFRTKQLSELSSLLSSPSALYSKARASYNLRVLESSLQDANQQLLAGTVQNLELRKQLDANTFALEEAKQQVAAFETATLDTDSLLANRDRLNGIYRGQNNGRALNTLESQGGNFPLVEQLDSANAPAKRGHITPERSLYFDHHWLAAEGLASQPPDANQSGAGAPADQPGNATNTRQLGSQQAPLGPRQLDIHLQANATANAKATPAAAAERQHSNRELPTLADQNANDQTLSDDYRRQVERYHSRLQANVPNSQSAASALTRALETDSRAPTNAPQAFGDTSLPNPPAATGSAPSTDNLNSRGKALSGELAANAAVVGPIWASLDVELPNRGQTFLFTTPGGELHLTAQSVPWEILGRFLAVVLILITVCIALYACSRLLQFTAKRTGLRLVTVSLTLVGLGSLLLGLLPVYGGACLLVAAWIGFQPQHH
ncbi:hypothetical protein [Aureliella helgolandensis]|uniref:Uncharacterized protein n=1 Tax=Aureliella helgolandensis TaxID=2527968 RepID=A0A518G703_9BACT|nr:hypothetical protein [Aureliella helgolandensis]QDV24369.1 hypothetical protein Q31a_26860 [Aureliella helgolandensis]